MLVLEVFRNIKWYSDMENGSMYRKMLNLDLGKKCSISKVV